MRQAQLQEDMGLGSGAELALELSELVWATAAAGVRLRHPEYRAREVDWAVARLRIGDELFRAAYPEAPLLAS